MESDRLAVCAAGEAAWLAVAYAGLGAELHVGDDLVWGPVVPHRFLLGAVTLLPRPELPDGLTGTLRDSWAALGLTSRWQAQQGDPWMFRRRGRCVVPDPAGVTVERTSDAALFEHTAFLAAGGAPPAASGELHPPGSAALPGLQLFLALRAGWPIGTGLSVVHRTGVLVSGIAVVARERRRGIGAALTAAVINTAADRPATLSASSAGVGTYLRLGFEHVGHPIDWVRRGP